jgi:hypothetical protein
VSAQALVRLEGAAYSVPCHWKRLAATAYVGPVDIRFVCRGEAVVAPRQRFGGRLVRYRHYLPELARKPQAVRQVAAELVAELGEPFGALWRLLVDAHGPKDAARTLARVLGAIGDHGEPAVAAAVRTALAGERADLLALAHTLTQRPAALAQVPASLARYEIAGASAAAYDTLLRPEAAHE